MTDHAPDSDSARSTPRESDALFDRLLAGDLSPEEIDALPDDMKEAARSIKDGSELFGRQSVLKTTLGKESRPMLAPRRFGRFVLIEEIGRGGQGAVWRAEDTERGDEVALKYLDRWVRSKKEPLARFVREQTILLRLNHDAIARVRDSGVERGVPWIAMEFVPGVSLSAWIEAKRKHGDAAPLDDQKRLLRFFIAAARGLHTAHAAGVVHRDIKPGNIMVRPDGSPVILDFGLARDLLDSNALTETGDLLGTPAYLAPEQLTRQSIPADHRTDVYGLGAAIYEAFTGRLPFVEPTRERLYAAILTSEPPPMHTIKKSIGKPLSLIVATALEKDRNRRYAGADLFADDLERALDEKPILARPLSWPAQIARAARRRPAAAVACVLLLLIFALGGFIAARWGDIERGQEADRRDEIAAALEHGYLLLGEGEPDDARRAFERAIELDEMTLEAWVGRIILESSRRNLDEARRLLTEAEKRFGRARALSPIERRLRAPVDRRAAVEFDATTADDLTLFVAGQLILADAHRGGGAGFADACRLMQMACLRSDHVRRLLVFELSHAATHAKDEYLLRTVTHDLTRRWPDSSKAHFWSGFADIESAPERAVEKFRRALAIEPDLYVARYNLAHCLNTIGRYEESMIETDAILAARPGNADAAITKADGLIALGRAEEALKVIDAMTLVPAVEARADLARAKAEIDLRRYDRAIQVLDKMIELGRLPNLARLQRSFAHFALGRSKDGFSDLEKCLEDDPENLEALTMIVRALIETLQFDRCVPYTEKIVAQSRSSAASRAVAAFGLAMAKEFRRALEVADTVRLAPNDIETAVSLARTYYAIGAEDRAVEIARTYSDRDPRARWLLARSAFDHGRFEEASAIWKRTIEESAKFPSLASTTKQELEAADRFQARARRARELRIADAGIDATPAEVSELAFAAAMSGDFESFDWIETKSRPMRKPDETFDSLWLVKLRAQAIKLESTDPADLAGRKAAAAKLARDVDRFIEDLEIAREESPASSVIRTLDGSVESSPFLRLLHARAKLDPESAKLLETALDRLLKYRRELAAELKRPSTK